MVGFFAVLQIAGIDVGKYFRSSVIVPSGLSPECQSIVDSIAKDCAGQLEAAKNRHDVTLTTLKNNYDSAIASNLCTTLPAPTPLPLDQVRTSPGTSPDTCTQPHYHGNFTLCGKSYTEPANATGCGWGIVGSVPVVSSSSPYVNAYTQLQNLKTQYDAAVAAENSRYSAEVASIESTCQQKIDSAVSSCPTTTSTSTTSTSSTTPTTGTTSGSTTTTLCPNGFLDAGEDCDGTATCLVPGTTCVECKCVATPTTPPPTPTTPPVASVPPYCGDNLLNQPTEQCDGTAGACLGGLACGKDCKCPPIIPPPPRCGDGILGNTPGEQCDDGNNVNGDGCDAACKIEVPKCGDRIVGNTPGEQCDDGNNINGDGCDAACKIEGKCGDGIPGNTPGEVCDPPGALTCPNAQACTATCGCPGGPLPICGDRIVGNTPGEQCDDGNIVNGDGCSATCQDEPGPVALTNPTPAAPTAPPPYLPTPTVAFIPSPSPAPTPEPAPTATHGSATNCVGACALEQQTSPVESIKDKRAKVKEKLLAGTESTGTSNPVEYSTPGLIGSAPTPNEPEAVRKMLTPAFLPRSGPQENILIVILLSVILVFSGRAIRKKIGQPKKKVRKRK